MALSRRGFVFNHRLRMDLSLKQAYYLLQLVEDDIEDTAPDPSEENTIKALQKRLSIGVDLLEKDLAKQKEER